MKFGLLGAKLTASNPAARTHTFDLLHFGEAGLVSWHEPDGTVRPARVTAAAGALTIPAGPLPVNEEHDASKPRGVMSVTEQGDKLVASVAYFDTAEGRKAWQDATDGTRAGISVEIDKPVVKAGAFIGGVLEGAGQVKVPAFPSSKVTASEAEPVPDTAPDGEGDAADAAQPVTAEDVQSAIDTLKSIQDTLTEQENSTMGVTASASAPAATDKVLASLANMFAAKDEQTQDEGAKATAGLSLTDYVSTVHNIRSGLLQGEKLTAALATVTETDVLSPAAVPAFLGELWDGTEYFERWADLVTHDDLTALTYKGWEWVEGLGPIVDDWDPAFTQGDYDATPPTPSAMNDIPSREVQAVAREWTARRIAGGNRFDRAVNDFPVPGQMESYLREQTDYIKRRRDARVREHLLNVARPIVGTGADISTTWRRVILGAQHVMEDAAPTYALLGNDIYRDLLGSDMLENLALLEVSLGLKEGTLAGFKIRPASITDTAMNGRVVVGSGKVTHLHEPSGSPIRVDTQELSKGAVDKAVFSYYLLRTNLVHKSGDPLDGKAKRGIVEVKA